MRKKLLSLIFFIISFLSLESQTVLTYEGQTYNNTTTSNWSGIDIPRSVLTTFTFRNNSVTSVNVQGYMLQAGDEGVAPTNGNLNSELITGNRFNWNGNFDGLLPNMVITHGVFTGCNINVNIRYNYLSRVPMGIIRKSGNSMTNTSGGVSYNILKTFNVGGVVKGMNNVNWYNNTFYNDRSRSQTWRPCIEIYENTDVTPTALARGTKIKNNIFYTKYKTYAIGITTDSRNGFECDYNVYWCEEGDHMPVFSVNGSELTWTQWKALGYDAHSVVINPNFIDFTNFVPTTRLDYGTDLGTSFNTGLSTSATWTVGSSPTTQIQNGTWQVGARIYSPTTPSTTARYVATNGNDGNPGTIDLPWKTWQKGFSSATSGDTVYIRGGVYYPSATNFNIWYNANAGVYINGKNGTSTSKIVVQNYPNETPILDCSSITNPTYRFGVVLAYCNYWTIKGLTVRNTAQYDEGTGGSGFWFFSVNNCLFERLVSYDNGGSGITLLSSSDQNTILNCDAYNNYDQYSGGFNADGIEVSFITDRTPKRTNYIKGCRSWNNSDDGYDHYAYNGFLFIENCWAWHNGYNKGGTTMTGDGNGFKLGKPEVVISTTTPYIVVKNCLAWDNKAGGYTLEDTYSSSNFVNIYNSVAYNNKCSWEAGFQGNVDGNSPNHIIRNNISYANVTNYASLTGTIDHNSWNGFSVSSADFVSLDAAGTIGNRQPDGSLPDLTFLRLAQGSDLIDGGINVGIPYYGSAPDLGAYETNYTSTIVIPTVTTTSISNITVTTATSGGNVTNNGGGTITARGVCWSTSQNPTTTNSKTTDGTGTGIFTSSITGLTGNTIYYVRAYATNSAGTAYGNQISFESAHIPPTVSTTAITNITTTSAVSGGNVTLQGGENVTAKGVCWSTSSNPTIANSRTNDGTGLGSFVSNITGLSPSTTYHVRAYATNIIGTSYGSDIQFTTNNVPINPPTITTTNISNITSNSATGGGNITSDGGATVTARGVCWSTSQSPTITNSKTTDGTGTGSFTSSITGLSPNTTYYVRAYATNSIGTSYGTQTSFTTLINLPTLTTTPITNITTTTATSGGNITSDGGGLITARGVCWSTSQNPTIVNSKTTDGTGSGTFTSSITGLSPNTTYHVRAYATNSMGTSYGEQVLFTTTVNLPSVTTTQITSITPSTATGGGNVTSDGGSTVTVRGICWATTQNPTITNPKTTDGSGLGSFISSITGLSPNTTYYVRAYATNSVGTIYGSQVTFTTSINLPSLTTSSISNITTTTATGGGNITSDGGASVTAKGICWATTQNPTITNSKTTDGSGIGLFTSNMTGLSLNTTYYVRAYATNSAGTSYGNQVSFTTLSDLPTLTTSPISNITTTTATSGGNITSDGGSNVTARGICWATTQNPTIANSKTINGTGIGSFISNITGLSLNTTYYVRAYATNSVGTSYGNQISFNTLANLPTLTTNSITNITSTTASGGGNITSDGGSNVTARGICWSTTQNPTIVNTKTTDGIGTGSFVSLITGLSPNITYYVRAYATNSVGTSYGNQISFTTVANLPTLTTSSISNITPTTATGGGNITSDGGTTITVRGICWSISSNPTITSSKTIDGGGTGIFTSSMTGLVGNTVYYVRAYATNSVGTSYGNEISFKSGSLIPTISTVPAVDITYFGAVSGGNITSDGGENVTARGVCWSTLPNPTISNSYTNDGSGLGTFSSNISGLLPSTTYYVRAYATNIIGTAYGNSIQFTTSDKPNTYIVTNNGFRIVNDSYVITNTK